MTDHSSVLGDEKGEVLEISENTPFWKTCLEESSRADTAMIDELNKTLDVILIFAGLFSAVVTTFVVDSYKSLQPDPTALTNNIMLEVAYSLRAHNTSHQNITAPFRQSTPSSPTSFTPPNSVIWLNGLWFSSLTLSLLVAALAMLCKQWLYSYSAGPLHRVSLYEQSLLRSYRRKGITRWRLSAMINMLPTVLHVSLGLFLAGLVAFLLSLHVSIGLGILVIVCLAAILYSLSTVAPTVYSDCPYRAPLSTELHRLRQWFRYRLYMARVTNRFTKFLFSLGGPQLDPTETEFRDELRHARQHAPDLSVEAVAWVLRESQDQSSIDIAAQAIAGLPKTAMIHLHRVGALPIVCEKFAAASVTLDLLLQQSRNPLPPGFQATIRCYCRAFVQLVHSQEHWKPLIPDSSFLHGLQACIQNDDLDYTTKWMVQCALLTYLMASETALLEPDLENHLDSVLSPMTDRNSDGPVSPTTARVIFDTLYTCIRLRTWAPQLALAEGNQTPTRRNPKSSRLEEIIKLKTVPVLIESQHRAMLSNSLVRQMSDQWLAHVMLKDDEEFAGLEKQRDDKSTENLRLILSLWTIYKSRDQLRLLQIHTEITVWKLINLISRPDVKPSCLFASLPSLSAAPRELVGYLLAVRAPFSNELVEAATRIVTRGRSFMDYTLTDAKYIQLATKFLPRRTLTERTVDMLVTNGGFLILVKNMQAPGRMAPAACTALVLPVLQWLLDGRCRE